MEAFAAHRTQCSGTNFYHRSGEGRKKGLEIRLSTRWSDIALSDWPRQSPKTQESHLES